MTAWPYKHIRRGPCWCGQTHGLSNYKLEFESQAADAPDLLAALRDLREACVDAYKAGRIPAEPFVRAGNVIAKAEGE